MQILLFGGSFNPPHLGHQGMIEQVLSKELPDGRHIDQVWLVPVGRHSFQKEFVAVSHRLAMLELLKQDLVHKQADWSSKIVIERFEIERPGESQTYLTLEALSKQYPEHQFSFLIGSDNLVKFHLWQHYEQMLRNYPFYVYPRENHPLEPLYSGMIPLTSFPEITVSSTLVRQYLLEGNELSSVVNPAITNYIKRERLYSYGTNEIS